VWKNLFLVFLAPNVMGLGELCDRPARALLPPRQGGRLVAAATDVGIVTGVVSAAGPGGAGRGRAEANFASWADTKVDT
jgi:hypothetical protein